jgi:hypothetical protein
MFDGGAREEQHALTKLFMRYYLASSFASVVACTFSLFLLMETSDLIVFSIGLVPAIICMVVVVVVLSRRKFVYRQPSAHSMVGEIFGVIKMDGRIEARSPLLANISELHDFGIATGQYTSSLRYAFLCHFAHEYSFFTLDTDQFYSSIFVYVVKIFILNSMQLV